MAEIAGVQRGNINALETALISLQHRGAYRTWARRTEYAASLTSATLPLSRYQKFGPQFKQNLKHPFFTSTSTSKCLGLLHCRFLGYMIPSSPTL